MMERQIEIKATVQSAIGGACMVALAIYLVLQWMIDAPASPMSTTAIAALAMAASWFTASSINNFAILRVVRCLAAIRDEADTNGRVAVVGLDGLGKHATTPGATP